MEMEQIQLNAWANLIRSSNLDGFNDDFVSNDEVMEQEEIEDDPQKVLLNLENQIEKQKDHGMDLLIDNESPMQMLNLILK